ncbi:hypothetical protein Hanom_Chr16g01518431 [Helianthus anomalus]
MKLADFETSNSNEAAPQRRHLKNDVKGNRFLDGYNPGTLCSRKPGIYRNAYGHHLPEMYNGETCFLQLIEPNTAGVGKISCKQIDTTVFSIALGYVVKSALGARLGAEAQRSATRAPRGDLGDDLGFFFVKASAWSWAQAHKGALNQKKTARM